MSVILWISLGIVAVAAIWLAWRYVRLRRALRRFANGLLDSPPESSTSMGELQGLATAVRTILGQLARRNSEVAAERDRLSSVLDQMTAGVLMADGDGVIQYANSAAAQLFDMPQPLGKTVTEVVRNHQLVAVWRGSRKSGGTQTDSVEVQGGHQYLQLVVVPDSRSGGSLLLVQDLTRLRRLETVRQDFVTNVSHELRTPLASLRALAETLMDGALQDPEAGPRFLGRIVSEVDSLAQMSQELLELSAIESGKAELRRAPVQPARLLEHAAERMRLQAERAGLALRVEAIQDLPSLQADHSRLADVLVNLIHNAIKFTPPDGEIVLSARLATDESQMPASAPMDGGADTLGAVQFSVADTGRGIPEEDRGRIFERFFRGDPARRKGGTGLGLSIARHIVEAHGGRIWVESAVGQGSTFHFIIP